MNRTTQPQLPFVSVVVPAYNARRTIGACVASLLAQDYPNDRREIIIVDNNSTDGTAEIVKQYPATLLYERGIQTSYAARNRGIRHARGEIVALTDVDCIPDRQWLRLLVPHFTNEDVVGVVGTIDAFPDPSIVAEFFASLFRPAEATADEPRGAPTGNVAYRRREMLSVGLFDEVLFGGGDIDLSWRIQVHTGGRMAYEPRAVVLHQHRATVKGLFKQYRRYGYNEILLTTLHRGKPYHQRTPKYQLKWMLRQVQALITYVLSFGYRAITWPIHRRDRKYLLWPLLWFVAEAGNLLGKVDGLIDTRFFRRNPFSSRADIVR